MCPYKGWHQATNKCVEEKRGDLQLDTSMCDDGSGFSNGSFPNYNGYPSSGGGGNSGGGGAPPPNDYDGSDPDIHGNGGNIITSPNTGCRGAGCLEYEEEDKKCEELNKLVESPDVNNPNPYIQNYENLFYPRSAILNMYTGLNTLGEQGFAFDNIGNVESYGSLAKEFDNPSSDHINFPPRAYRFGSIHTHPVNDSGYPMFSPGDIYSLIRLKDHYSLSNTSGDALFVNMLTVKQAGETHTYAIKINDYNKLDKLKDIYENNRKWRSLREDLRDAYEESANGTDGAASQYKKTFLNFLKHKDLGVSLYEMEVVNPGTPNVDLIWNELTLNPNESINKNPCD